MSSLYELFCFWLNFKQIVTYGYTAFEMACLYTRKNSPFWWLKYRRGGDIVMESTGLRWNNPDDTKKARKLKAQRMLEEADNAQNSPQERFPAWAPVYLNDRYKSSPKTLLRYRNCLRAVLVFLGKQNIAYPRQLRYNDILDYVKWRQKPDDPSVYKACLNTVLTDLKVLRIVMREAVRRSFATENPCLALGIKREAAQEKPEISAQEIAAIRQELDRMENGTPTWPEWMKTSFEIAIRQGCRLRETCLPLRDIDLSRETITFNAKGGKRFTTALHPELIPMVKKWKAEGRA
ncbi:MAG: phage integrase SAM-like domain-containing protein, partial [Verrucomicrobiae bacterium]|nr:phage integrase SAM-like domain-containing protein [Verrucomicrobiae bacterium]